MKQIIVPSKIDQVAVVTSFIDEYLEECSCPIKVSLQIDIAIDEIFSNIVYYAYDDTNKDSNRITVSIEKLDNPEGVVISFIDNGKKYNPLEKEDPDTTLSADDRQIGGLGIFIVKKSMDEVSYKYEDKSNIFTITKYFFTN